MLVFGHLLVTVLCLFLVTFWPPPFASPLLRHTDFRDYTFCLAGGAHHSQSLPCCHAARPAIASRQFGRRPLAPHESGRSTILKHLCRATRWATASDGALSRYPTAPPRAPLQTRQTPPQPTPKCLKNAQFGPFRVRFGRVLGCWVGSGRGRGRGFCKGKEYHYPNHQIRPFTYPL